MEDKLQKLNTFKKVELSDSERGVLKARLSQIVSANVCIPASAVPSFFYRGVQHGLRISLSALFFVVFVGGSVSAIADSALPGDPLYTFKINVNEEVKGVFLNTPEEKVAFQKNRVETRVKEIKTLAESETLTTAKQAKAREALSSQVEKLSKELTTLSDTTPTAALTVTASIEESLKETRARITEKTNTNENSEDVATMARLTTANSPMSEALRTVDEALEKVSKEEVKILSKELNNIAKEIEQKSQKVDSQSENTENKETSTTKQETTPSGS